MIMWQGVQAGHAEIEGEIKLAVEVDVRVVRQSLFDFLLFQSQFFWIIAGHGVRGMVCHVKAAAGDEMGGRISACIRRP